MNIGLSYIIVTYDSADHIVNCLRSIYGQKSINVKSEIIIIDNASSDSTVDVIAKQFSQVSLKQNHKNLGFAAAVNQAVSASHGEYILLLNPDTVLEHNFLEIMFSFLQKTPDADIVGVKLVDENNNHHPSAWKKVSLMTILFEMILPYSLSIKLVTQSPEKPSIVQNVSGACMLIRRDVFDKLNGFDTRFFLYYEEIDFCKRAVQSGYKVYYNPDTIVTHFISKSTFKDQASFFFNLYNGKLLYIKKHFNFPFYAAAYCLIVIGIILRIIISFISGLVTFRNGLLRLSKSLIFALIKIIKTNRN